MNASESHRRRTLRLACLSLWLLVLASLVPQHVLAQTAALEAQLTITPGGHTGRIHDVAVTRDRRYLLSCGDDKTIRVWDLEQDRPAEVLAGQIGAGLDGQLYALALSPDNQWLAVAGYLNGHVIRLYDWPSRRLVALLSGHTNVINALAFTTDSRRLISASADKTLRLWNVATRQTEIRYTGHTRNVLDVATSADRFVSTSQDGTVKLWALDRERELATATSHRVTPDAVAMSDQGTIASGADDGQVVLYDRDLREVTRLDNGVGPSALAFSPGGGKLLTGSASRGQDRCHVWERFPDGSWRQSGGRDGGYAGHDNTVMAVGWVDERRAVTAGGDDGRIAVWTLSFGGSLGGELDEEHVFASQGRPLAHVAVSADGKRLGFGVRGTDAEAHALPTEVFDLATGSVAPLPPDQALNYSTARLSNGDYTLMVESTGGLADNTLVLRKSGQRVSSVTRTATDGFRHRAVTWVGPRYVSGGNFGTLAVFDKQGRAVAQLVGHQGDVLAVAPTADGRMLWSASADQTLALWNLDEIESAQGSFPTLIETFTGAGWQSFFAREPYRDLARTPARSAWSEVISRMRTARDANANVLENRLRRLSVNLRPVLQLFIGADHEWVLWSPSGVYSASADGEKYIAWHVNRGASAAADRYPVAYLRSQYYRPERIERILALGSLEAALREERSGTPAEPTPPSASLNSLPVLNWRTPASATSTATTASYNIELDVQSPSPVTSVWVLVNGRPATTARGLTPVPTPTLPTGPNVLRRTLNLVPGDNTISVIVENSSGRGSSQPRVVTYGQAVPQTPSQKPGSPDTEARFKPTLYTLHIGVSKHRDPTLNLQFAATDAQALHAAWQGQAGGLFKEVKTTLLTDQQATRRNILRALADISKQATQRDLVIVSFAGHGVNDLQNRFYLLPYEVETADLVTTAIRYSELTDLLGDLPGKVVVMLDACHSGNFARQGLARRNVQVADDFVRELTSSEVGVVVMAASTGRQPSVESSGWGHGAFTKAILDALAGRGDYNGDHAISLKELDLAVTEGVKTLTAGEQKPVTYTPADLPNFPLYFIWKK